MRRGFLPVRPESRLSIRDLNAVVDKSIEPLDEIYFASYNPIVQVGAIVASTAIITWSYLRKTGRERIFWISVGSIPLLLLVVRNMTASWQRRRLSERIGLYVNMSERINDLFHDMPDLTPPGGDSGHPTIREASSSGSDQVLS